MGVEVVQLLVDILFSLFCCLCLFRGNTTKGDECGEVNSCIVHDGADNLLNAEDTFGW